MCLFSLPPASFKLTVVGGVARFEFDDPRLAHNALPLYVRWGWSRGFDMLVTRLWIVCHVPSSRWCDARTRQDTTRRRLFDASITCLLQCLHTLFGSVKLRGVATAAKERYAIVPERGSVGGVSLRLSPPPQTASPSSASPSSPASSSVSASSSPPTGVVARRHHRRQRGRHGSRKRFDWATWNRGACMLLINAKQLLQLCSRTVAVDTP